MAEGLIPPPALVSTKAPSLPSDALQLPLPLPLPPQSGGTPAGPVQEKGAEKDRKRTRRRLHSVGHAHDQLLQRAATVMVVIIVLMIAWILLRGMLRG